MRKNKKCLFTVFGETLTLKEIAAKYGIKYDTLYAVHRRSKSDEKAVENAVRRLANLTAESVAGLAKSLPDGELSKLKKMLK